jgi:hypothetical protein
MLLFPLAAAAQPIALRCKTTGATNAMFGTLSIVVDEEARTVRVEAPEALADAKWIYQDGAVAPVFVGDPEFMKLAGMVEQFVKVTPTRIELGWRNLDGELEHLAWFNRSALHNGKSCRWHSLWLFDTG